MSLPDEALVDRARAGDAAAFSELYVRYRRLVFSVLLDRVRDPEVINDLVQEVFTRALESLPNLRDPSRFRPWIASIARHVVVDSGRRASRQEPLDPERAMAVPDPDPSPEELAELMALTEQFEAAVLELSDRDALALSLASLGFTASELAPSLGVSPGAAKVALHRARRRLSRVASMRQMLDAGVEDMASAAVVERFMRIPDPEVAGPSR